VKAGAFRVVLDLDLGAEVADETVQRLALGPADVRRCHDPNRNACFARSRQLTLDKSKAVPHDKCAQQVDRVG
jgi:hypothetical protein